MKEFRELTRRRKKPIPIAVRIAGCKPGMRISRRGGGTYKNQIKGVKGEFMTRLEKLDRKYGDPFLKSMAKKTKAAQNYYELWLTSQQEKRVSEIESLIAYFVAFLFIAFSDFAQAPYMGIPGVAFLCFATHCACNVRVETLWCARFLDGMYEAVRIYNLEEAVHKLKNKEAEDE